MEAFVLERSSAHCEQQTQQLTAKFEASCAGIGKRPLACAGGELGIPDKNLPFCL
jgi:hypothetical protein